MRVLHITLDIFDGGASRCARELLELLPAYGVEASAWVSRHRGTAPLGLRVIRRPWENRLGFLEAFPGSTDWRHRGSISELKGIRRSLYDVIHLHTIHSGAVSIRAVRDLCLRMPVVWTLHDEWPMTGGYIYKLDDLLSGDKAARLHSRIGRILGYSPYHDNFRVRDMSRLLRKALPQPRVLVAPSHHMADLAARSGKFPKSEIAVVRNGVRMLEVQEAQLPRDEARRRLNLPAAGQVVLMMAPHLQLAHKGIPFGIEALNRLCSNTEAPPHVLMVGRGAHLLQSKLGCQSSAFRTERDSELATAYRAADATLVPSLAESFSLVAAESMACSTPVVSFRVGGLVELIGQDERGLAVDPFDVQALSTQLAVLLGYPQQRARLGEAGRRWIRAECSMERHVQGLIEQYGRAVTMGPTTDPRTDQ